MHAVIRRRADPGPPASCSDHQRVARGQARGGGSYGTARGTNRMHGRSAIETREREGWLVVG
jgi:hypothetical protein